MGSKSNKISIRITPWQEQVLSELSGALGVGYSLLIRTIIGNWLEQNEEFLYKFIDKKNFENADNKQNPEETEELFREDRDRYEATEEESL